MSIPALIVAGTHSGSGKTTVTLAILAALARRGLCVQAYKVGPDFIDPGHHAKVTGRPGRNLDTWLLDPASLARAYRRGAPGADIAVIEGVMGLFDGRGSLDESGSTADLARAWGLPVVLVVDARGMARSIAPMVLGYARFDESVRVEAVVANKVGSERHFSQYLAPSLRAAVPGVDPLGYFLRDERLTIPSRHLGLLTADEFGPGSAFLDALADAAEANLDLDRLIELARPPQLADPALAGEDRAEPRRRAFRVAQARDAAFCFYYEDNLDALRDEGVDVVPFSPLDDPEIPPDIDLLYLGGGYPESFAERLASNSSMRTAIRRYHAQGGAIYAECGGLMACTESIRDHSGSVYPMWGLIPARAVMQEKFTTLGYVTATTDAPTLLGPPGMRLRGHEFHYSTLEPRGKLTYSTRLERPGHDPKSDGIQIGGLLAGYAHLHFGSNAEVVDGILGAGRT